MSTESGKQAAKPTVRVVLKRERVLVLPDGIDDATVKAAIDALKKGSKGKAGRVAEAWLAVGEYEGSSDTKAIERYAGKPGTPDALVGVFKAPALTNWKGGAVYDAPPAPLVERRPLED